MGKKTNLMYDQLFEYEVTDEYERRAQILNRWAEAPFRFLFKVLNIRKRRAHPKREEK
jgi:hypothetical protein